MRTLYLSQQGCWVTLKQEFLRVLSGRQELYTVPLPTLQQVLIFGYAQMTTQAIRACLVREIPIAYLSQTGYCYGRVMPLARGYRGLAQRQQAMAEQWRLQTAQQIVRAKLLNSRVLLMRQLRETPTASGAMVVNSLSHLAARALQTDRLEPLLGIEGIGAALYFPELGNCLRQEGFILLTRTRRPPTNPVNALLSFGYSVLWNHLFTLIELQDLHPYEGCLHRGNRQHAALVSDLLEEFRAPIIDSLMLSLINRRILDADQDFMYEKGGCFLNETGRKKFLKSFLERMSIKIKTQTGTQPFWDVLTQQVRQYKQCIFNPEQVYQPYQIR
ncbi:CRISPR-associated Cas1 family protein [Gloeomargarita lithophora Alchichica-D10]|uniref:CRISPR-associated endonuclease Cas1 n=1 Tax=Gloeomargarita lithophora Alchichica-D10 TaxID=1188229 RepID=A0A1J0AAM3_9CYAN|nr:CRISPR-associated endonuclease Cas1 [Gloeomargarita lithophora]APB32957.1 CRISPR-associated Cas1 family protein [Gloeomargarita lithophora Alchichica-D10]